MPGEWRCSTGCCRRRRAFAGSSSCSGAIDQVGLVVPSGSLGGAGDVGLEPGARRGAGGANSLRLRPRHAALPGRLDVLGAAVGSPPAGGSSARTGAFRAGGGSRRRIDRARARALRGRRGRQASGLDVVETDDVSLAAAPRAAEADPAAPGARLLPASVPSDPRERRLVGDRVHRLGERRPRPPALRGARAAGRAGRARPIRPVGSRCDAQPGGAGRGARRRRIRHAPLLVRRAEAPRHAAAQPARRPVDRLPVRAVLGERELDAALGRPRLGRAHRSELQRGLGRPVLRRHSSRRSTTRGT